MKIVATICSRKKADSSHLLEAQDRYLGEHIKKVRVLAADLDVPFYILSGTYGLIAAETLIPDYDYLLLDEAVPELAAKIGEQIREAGITEIVFYTESNPNWKPYEKAAQEGARAGDADFVMHHL